MVSEITGGGLIVSLSAHTTALLDEFVSLCEWPALLRPTPRDLFQHIESSRPACLLFWLESDGEITPAAQLVARLRDRGPRPYRIAIAHCLDGSVEHTFRTAGVHSYFAVAGNLRALVSEGLLPFVDQHRAAAAARTAHAPETRVPIRSPTEARGSPATMHPP